MGFSSLIVRSLSSLAVVLCSMYLHFSCQSGLDEQDDSLTREDLKILTNLSEYGFFQSPGGISEGTRDRAIIQDGVPFEAVPYELNTPLFSDYAHKDRAILIPEGEKVVYNGDREFDFPVGSVIIKTFSLGEGQVRADSKPGKKLETRLLIRQNKGWYAVSYVWDGNDQDAQVAYAGKPIPLRHTYPDGKEQEFVYSVPSRNQCASCHQSYEGRKQSIVPIGIKAKHLNRDGQLEEWKDKGVLRGLPFFSVFIPKLVDASDSNQSIEDRARAYLDINCSHCHNTNAAGGINSKLILSSEEEDRANLGVCKTPGSAGKGGGGLRYDIVPGHPAQSILFYRTATTDPGAMMPQIGRALTHIEGVDILREWIQSMEEKECP